MGWRGWRRCNSVWHKHKLLNCVLELEMVECYASAQLQVLIMGMDTSAFFSFFFLCKALLFLHESCGLFLYWSTLFLWCRGFPQNSAQNDSSNLLSFWSVASPASVTSLQLAANGNSQGAANSLQEMNPLFLNIQARFSIFTSWKTGEVSYSACDNF